jgi:predicted NUDIX family NTP pyrophosphohydrolase
MPKQSAGILLYRRTNNTLQVFLAHPGGPFFKNKDEGSWTIPKGEFLDDEEPLAAAKREFQEETGQPINGDFISLGSVKQKSGKTVFAWAVEGDINAEDIVSNTFNLEWPPKSGKMMSIPEVDRAEWFDVVIAKHKINPAQIPLIERFIDMQ